MKLFNRREPAPVKKIQVSDTHFSRKVILLAVFVAIAIVSIGFGIYYAVTKEAGWRVMEVRPGKPSCAQDFVLTYRLEGSRREATAEYKDLEALYTQAVVEAYRLFDWSASGSELAKIRPNQTVTVDENLYEALKLVKNYESRLIYLAPVYQAYQRVFTAESEAEASLYDPLTDADTKAFVTELAAFANDPAMIDLEILPEKQVRLQVAEAYLQYAADHEITVFLDFGWTRNAFVADYLARRLSQAGHTRGYLASYDGFTRNLDSGAYTTRLFHGALVEYQGPMSMVHLRSYPIDDRDRWHYFAFSDGHIVAAMVDPADGMSKSATEDLLGYSQEKGCGELLLTLAPVYLQDTLDTAALERFAQEGIFSAWLEETVFKTTDTGLLKTKS